MNEKNPYQPTPAEIRAKAKAKMAKSRPDNSETRWLELGALVCIALAILTLIVSGVYLVILAVGGIAIGSAEGVFMVLPMIMVLLFGFVYFVLFMAASQALRVLKKLNDRV